MNCCNDYGDCTGAGDCPARPAEVPKEAGNVWFVGPEPIPLTLGEAVFGYGIVIVLSLFSLVAISGFVGWVFQTFIGG